MIVNHPVANAIKYNRDGGRVDIRIQSDRQQATIAVSDTRIGPSAEDTGRLFNEFVRIRNERTQHVLGSRLRLSIVKKRALLYGGDVAVQSAPGAGSTFTVSLSPEPAPLLWPRPG